MPLASSSEIPYVWTPKSESKFTSMSLQATTSEASIWWSISFSVA